jgi:hypothetical protein
MDPLLASISARWISVVVYLGAGLAILVYVTYIRPGRTKGYHLRERKGIVGQAQVAEARSGESFTELCPRGGCGMWVRLES